MGLFLLDQLQDALLQLDETAHEMVGVPLEQQWEKIANDLETQDKQDDFVVRNTAFSSNVFGRYSNQMTDLTMPLFQRPAKCVMAALLDSSSSTTEPQQQQQQQQGEGQQPHHLTHGFLRRRLSEQSNATITVSQQNATLPTNQQPPQKPSEEVVMTTNSNATSAPVNTAPQQEAVPTTTEAPKPSKENKAETAVQTAAKDTSETTTAVETAGVAVPETDPNKPLQSQESVKTEQVEASSPNTETAGNSAGVSQGKPEEAEATAPNQGLVTAAGGAPEIMVKTEQVEASPPNTETAGSGAEGKPEEAEATAPNQGLVTAAGGAPEMVGNEKQQPLSSSVSVVEGGGYTLQEVEETQAIDVVGNNTETTAAEATDQHTQAIMVPAAENPTPKPAAAASSTIQAGDGVSVKTTNKAAEEVQVQATGGGEGVHVDNPTEKKEPENVESSKSPASGGDGVSVEAATPQSEPKGDSASVSAKPDQGIVTVAGESTSEKEKETESATAPQVVAADAQKGSSPVNTVGTEEPVVELKEEERKPPAQEQSKETASTPSQPASQDVDDQSCPKHRAGRPKPMAVVIKGEDGDYEVDLPIEDEGAFLMACFRSCNGGNCERSIEGMDSTKIASGSVVIEVDGVVADGSREFDSCHFLEGEDGLFWRTKRDKFKIRFRATAEDENVLIHAVVAF